MYFSEHSRIRDSLDCYYAQHLIAAIFGAGNNLMKTTDIKAAGWKGEGLLDIERKYKKMFTWFWELSQ